MFQWLEIDSFTIDHENFGINNKEILDRILKQLKTINTIFGYGPDDARFSGLRYYLAFTASGVGVIIGADEMNIVNHKGNIAPEEIDDMNNKWWQYWREYWNLKGSAKELPKDYACEVTIPLAPGK